MWLRYPNPPKWNRDSGISNAISITCPRQEPWRYLIAVGIIAALWKRCLIFAQMTSATNFSSDQSVWKYTETRRFAPDQILAKCWTPWTTITLYGTWKKPVKILEKIMDWCWGVEPMGRIFRRNRRNIDENQFWPQPMARGARGWQTPRQIGRDANHIITVWLYGSKWYFDW